MKNKILLLSILTLTVLSSCNPCLRYAKLSKRCGIDSIAVYRTDTIKDTTIEVIIFNDTVWINKEIKVPHYIRGKVPYLNLDTITKEIGVIGLQIWINNNILGSHAYLTDSTILIKTKVFSRVTDKRSNKTIYIKENTSFAHFAIWFFWIFIIITIIYFTFKFFSSKFNALFNVLKHLKQ